ncbi:TPA: hypothetical protein N0H29_002633 [Pseudomonas aeruginosa]|uniref:hypothetical protein n=1 Tax=Pseudomonas aeruginosa TaxID=287 RepID=UPI000F84A334|nr:hypothetical protein [Pseudomonas aeruginosa]MBG5667278.1 hypothetical protein [Pseudomonas aeruginosa]MDG4091739.1 hypothetical protein [Pseudomonas aeruginosa]RTT51494.1 hypothetical protein DY960_12535 [Pseudomonas aeruginosa]HCE6930713.1 hypothetical protein [Pseudomonas aeruginosa]HCE8530463.1 hypothetical protein [Pseudomonas aeruginosa]
MTEKLVHASTSGIATEFGFYPICCDIESEQFSIRTLPNHEETVSSIVEDANVIDGWLYPGPQKRLNFVSSTLRSMPYSSRVFGLPKTHVLTLSKSENQYDLDFVVWCLSLFTGMRLTTTEAGFLDATPVKPHKLVDFALYRCNLIDAVHLALNFLERERDAPRAPKRIAAVIHALFLAQYPQNLPFERFQYLYMALDGCFKLLEVKEETKVHVPHARRIQWMCEKFATPIPEWAMSQAGASSLSTVRNDAMHEALFFDEPLGFSIYGGNKPDGDPTNVTLQMQALVCRLLIAILGRADTTYVKSPINTRMIHSLELHDRATG